MKELIKTNLPLFYKVLIKIRNKIFGFSHKSYSQFGEDLVLYTFIYADGIKNGFYVDIGCYNPVKYSNTNFYYKRGWHGINIDARPGSVKLFNKKRRRDINVEMGISKENDNLNFYLFKDGAYNTFSKELAEHNINNGVTFNRKITIKTMKLGDFLDCYLPINQKIDFMSIDVEGFDLNVLKSNNWKKYSPSYILVESHDFNLENIKNSLIFQFLTENGYKLVSVVYVTLIFKLDFVD